MLKVIERVKSQWIKRKKQDLFRGSSTQLYVPAFTQKDFQSTNFVHTGLPYREPPQRIWGNYNQEYTTPLSTNTTPTEATQTPPHTRGVGP